MTILPLVTLVAAVCLSADLIARQGPHLRV